MSPYNSLRSFFTASRSSSTIAILPLDSFETIVPKWVPRHAEFIAAFEALANVATKAAVEGRPLKVHTPLIELTKAEIIQAGAALGVDYARTVSCYQADERGRACGVCDSCRIRRAGFEAAGVPDPTRYQAG